MNLDDQIVTALERLSKGKPWMTALGLAIRISRMYKQKITEEEVEARLRVLEAKPNTKVRRSKLPSKTTLRELWGHIGHVKEKAVPPSEKVNVADSFFMEEVTQLDSGSPICFLSHSHKDVDKIVEIGKRIAAQGIYPWAAETEILLGQAINSQIVQAMQACSYFVALITPNSLESVWTRKEFDNAIQKFEKVILVVDESKEENLLMKIIEDQQIAVAGDGAEEAQATKNPHQFLPRIRDEIKRSKIVICFYEKVGESDFGEINDKIMTLEDALRVAARTLRDLG